MTIEEAIAELKDDIELYIPLGSTIEEVDRDLPDGRLITALEMAIKALKATLTIMSKQAEYDLDQEGLHNVAMGEKVVAGWHNSLRNFMEKGKII